MHLPLPTLLSLLLLLPTSIHACAHYKRCWCENGDRSSTPNDQATYDLCAQQHGSWGDHGALKADGVTPLMQCKAPEEEGWDNCGWAEACKSFKADTGYCQHKVW